MHQDRLGSVVALTNASGHVVERFSYGPYGELGSQPASGFPFRFTGQRLDPETGLYYYKARYYDPETGRFPQTDPIGYEDQMNLYAYVHNDPMNLKDPTGEVATVTVDEENKTVQIDVKVKYNDGATADQRSAVNSAIEDTYTGEFDGYDVTTTVTEVTESGDDVNEITIVNDYGRSSVKDNQFMTLYTQNPEGSFNWNGAHEGGHLLGLGDRYGLRFVPDRWNPNGGDYKSVPDPGYEGNVMGDADRYGVRGSQIERIIEADSNLVTRR